MLSSKIDALGIRDALSDYIVLGALMSIKWIEVWCIIRYSAQLRYIDFFNIFYPKKMYGKMLHLVGVYHIF